MNRQVLRAPSFLPSVANVGLNFDQKSVRPDVTNARELFGDIDPYGDNFEDDDHDQLGDVSVFDILDATSGEVADDFGDVDPYGDLSQKRKKQLGLGILGAAGGAFAVAAYRRSQKRRAQRKLAAQMVLNVSKNPGKISKTKKVPFFTIAGGMWNRTPIGMTAAFVAKDLEWVIDQMANGNAYQNLFNNTPVIAGNVYTTTITPTEDYFYYSLIIKVGAPVLTTSTQVSLILSFSMPLFNGDVLDTASDPFAITMGSKFNIKITVSPWKVVQVEPIFQAGKVTPTAPITVTVSGMPTNGTVIVIVPGSRDRATIGLRNALIS